MSKEILKSRTITVKIKSVIDSKTKMEDYQLLITKNLISQINEKIKTEFDGVILKIPVDSDIDLESDPMSRVFIKDKEHLFIIRLWDIEQIGKVSLKFNVSVFCEKL
jgi:hypothetical protein